MRVKYYIGILLVFLMMSCATVSVNTDYDTKVTFQNYKTFGFYKPAIDKVEISDLDKKRILRAIDQVMLAKGFTKSETPDLLVSIATKAQRNVGVYQNNIGFGLGWGWYNPLWCGTGFNNFNAFDIIEGQLFVDLIDGQKKELVWQGVGSAPLVEGPEAKEARIQEIVNAILAKYPPQKK